MSPEQLAELERLYEAERASPWDSDAAHIAWAAATHKALPALLETARKYQELTGALNWLADRGWWSMGQQRPDGIVAYAAKFGWKP